MMRSLTRNLWRDEAGVIISAELVLILTIVVLGVIVGLVQVQHAVVAELNDIGLAVSHLNQSYAFSGFQGGRKWWGPTSWTASSSFIDLYDGVGAVAVADFGPGYVDGGGYALDYGFGGYGAGYAAGGAVISEAVFGTIVLADGTLIPIRLIASGTWSLPGGMVLAATSATSNRLLLGDGTSIPFLWGLAGVVEFADGTVAAIRPGAAGTWVLADGRIVTIAADRENTVLLADGTALTVRWANLEWVILSNGTTVAVKSSVSGTLILIDERILRLHDAVIPEGSDANIPPAWLQPGRMSPQNVLPFADPQYGVPQGVIPQQEMPLPAQPLIPHQPGFSQPMDGLPAAPRPMPEGADPGTAVPSAPVPALNGCDGMPLWNGQPAQRSRWKLEIPQGPAPQYLPQL